MWRWHCFRFVGLSFCCRSRRTGEAGRRRHRLRRPWWPYAREGGGFDALALTHATLTQRHGSRRGGGLATSLARRRRFWAMAASVNSNWAPRGPRNRSRPSRRMRLRWANSISTRLRSRQDCSKASVPASARATSRASSWMLRGILRAGSFGQHRILNGHTSQSSLLALYSSWSSFTILPVVVSTLPAGHV